MDLKWTHDLSPNFLWILVITSLSATLLVALLYKFCFKRYELTLELGFGERERGTGRGDRDRTKRQLIRDLLQTKLSDPNQPSPLPPVVYPNGWFVILESDKLKIRSTVDVSVLGIDLVVWRGASGRAYIADAYCPHLGAHLGIGGTVFNDCIKCPFHGWQFDGELNGQLTKVPYSDCSKLGPVSLKIRRSLEQNGFIYMWYHAEGEEPTWYPQQIPQIEEKKLKYRGRLEFHVATLLQDIIENGADNTHFDQLHGPPELMGRWPWSPLNLYSKSLSIFRYIYTAEWQPCEEIDMTKGHMAISDLTMSIMLFNRWTFPVVRVAVIQEGPGLVQLEVKLPKGPRIGLAMGSSTPRAPIHQHVVSRMYSPSWVLQPCANLVNYFAGIMFSRDVLIWNRKSFLHSPLLTSEESAVKSFRRWYTQFSSKNSPRLNFRTTLEADLGQTRQFEF